MTNLEVLAIHQDVFYDALLKGDWDALSELYSDECTLVRLDGTALGKAEVLADLRGGGLVFKSIELRNTAVRLSGSMALLTGESTTVNERDGVALLSQFRFAPFTSNWTRTYLCCTSKAQTLPRTERS
jgi:hypothetical protein